MAKKKVVKKAAAKKPPTKSEVYAAVAEATDLPKKKVAEVFDAMGDVMAKSLKKNGTFSLVGLAKMTVVKKPAVKGGKLVRNPFTGEMVPQKPKPASKNVRIRPMKALKDMIN
ncbi:MAG: HU family DNA-binding protein [Planctomycetota bacterium]